MGIMKQDREALCTELMATYQYFELRPDMLHWNRGAQVLVPQTYREALLHIAHVLMRLGGGRYLGRD